MGKGDFNLCLECTAPKNWSKYTSSILRAKKVKFSNTRNFLYQNVINEKLFQFLQAEGKKGILISQNFQPNTEFVTQYTFICQTDRVTVKI